MRRAALDRDDWRCRRCSSPLDLEVHHLKAVAAGGAPYALDNVEVLCRDCHIGEHLDPERRAWLWFLRES